jgi:flagellar L-ring protein precursor FlgH
MNAPASTRRLRGLLVAVATLAACTANAQSLYDPASFRPLTADHKAFRVGDVVTVQVVENASATVNADTGSRRSTSIGADLTRVRSEAVRIGLEASGEFDGGGRTARAGRLLAQLSVTVREVLPNGDLRLEGEQRLTINDEQQRIYLEGRARPQDITDGNVVLSTRLADTRITYIGQGDLADRQRPAWWRKVLDWFGF